MRKLTLLLMVSVILGAFLTVEAIAQSSRVSAKQAGGSIVIGKTVRNAQGVVLGKVENIVLSEQGCAEYLILSGKFSGARGRHYPVPWTVVRVTEDPEFLMMDVDIAILREAPVIKDVRRIDVCAVGNQGPRLLRTTQGRCPAGDNGTTTDGTAWPGHEEKTNVLPEKRHCKDHKTKG